MDGALAQRGEFYMSSCYVRLLEDNQLVSAFAIEEYVSTGTPTQVKEYLRKSLAQPETAKTSGLF